MSYAPARDAYDELDALMREAMGLTSEDVPSEPAQAPLAVTWSDPSVEYEDNVVNLLERMSKSALQGYSRDGH